LSEHFTLFFTDDVIDLMVTETNRCHALLYEKRGADAGEHSRLRQWMPVMRAEMKVSGFASLDRDQ